jgi:hypothetical protein
MLGIKTYNPMNNTNLGLGQIHTQLLNSSLRKKKGKNKGKNWYILAGASGRNLAFGPTHVSSKSIPGEKGNSVIIGHRDTQFNSLKRRQKAILSR